MARYGMVIDLSRCIGCNTCTVACKIKNATPPGVQWCRVLSREVGKYPDVRVTNMFMRCMHCKNPPCLQACPTGAIYKRPDSIVAVDSNKCKGYRYCETACPYGALNFVKEIKPYSSEFGFTLFEKVGYVGHKAGVVEKCNFCMDRVDAGLEPACVGACPTRTLQFGDLDNPNSEVSKLITRRQGFRLLPKLGTNPAVYYLPA